MALTFQGLLQRPQQTHQNPAEALEGSQPEHLELDRRIFRLIQQAHRELAASASNHLAVDMFIDSAAVTPDDEEVPASAATDVMQGTEDGSGGARSHVQT